MQREIAQEIERERQGKQGEREIKREKERGKKLTEGNSVQKIIK